jgi:hypothetical protein
MFSLLEDSIMSSIASFAIGDGDLCHDAVMTPNRP